MPDERMQEVPELGREIAARLGRLPGVAAVALGGSSVAGNADERSDLDLYVYSPEPPSLTLRAELAQAYDPAPELDNRAFGPGDEWQDATTGLAVDRGPRSGGYPSRGLPPSSAPGYRSSRSCPSPSNTSGRGPGSPGPPPPRGGTARGGSRGPARGQGRRSRKRPWSPGRRGLSTDFFATEDST